MSENRVAAVPAGSPVLPRRAAVYQERDLNSTVQTAVGLLGPLMLLIMAGFVVLVVLSVILPMLEMNAFIGR